MSWKKKKNAKGTFFGKIVVPQWGNKNPKKASQWVLPAGMWPLHRALSLILHRTGTCFCPTECSGCEGVAFRARSQEDSKLLSGLWRCFLGKLTNTGQSMSPETAMPWGSPSQPGLGGEGGEPPGRHKSANVIFNVTQLPLDFTHMRRPPRENHPAESGQPQDQERKPNCSLEPLSFGVTGYALIHNQNAEYQRQIQLIYVCECVPKMILLLLLLFIFLSRLDIQRGAWTHDAEIKSRML